MYRQAPTEPIACPRCQKPMPPTEVTSCACGTWLSAFAADVVLSATERTPNRATRWWRRREPCPLCDEQMLLYGDEPGLLQGCEVHGYFIDADTIEHTSIASGVDHAAINARRDDETAVSADAEKRLEAERERMERQREKDEAEQRVRGDFAVTDPIKRNQARATEVERESRRAIAQSKKNHDQLARFKDAQQLLELVSSIEDTYPEVAELFETLGNRVAALESDREILTDKLARLETQVEWLTEKAKGAY